jgi:hypothetical protein
MGPKIEAMKEIAEFEVRYAKQLAGPMLTGASPEEMAAALAMYPGMTEALARMRAESVNLDGTPILTTVTIDAVKSAAEHLELEQPQRRRPDRRHRPPRDGQEGGAEIASHLHDHDERGLESRHRRAGSRRRGACRVQRNPIVLG